MQDAGQAPLCMQSLAAKGFLDIPITLSKRRNALKEHGSTARYVTTPKQLRDDPLSRLTVFYDA
jgi:hypothetical protein